MSDQPVAILVTTLIAAPLAVVCCAIGTAAFLAFASGTLAGTGTTLFGELGLPAKLFLASVAAFSALIVWNWWRNEQSRTMAELEDGHER